MLKGVKKEFRNNIIGCIYYVIDCFFIFTES